MLFFLALRHYVTKVSNASRIIMTCNAGRTKIPVTKTIFFISRLVRVFAAQS